MKQCRSLLAGLILVSATSTLSLRGLSDPPAGNIVPPSTILPTQAKKAPVVRDFGRLPLSFESNQGQTDSKVRFLTHSADTALFLAPSEALFTMPAQPARQHEEQASLQKG